MTETTHAVLSPSGAARWMQCPGSVALTEHLPDTSSVYADEGTAAHTIAESCLRGGFDASDFLGEPVKVGERIFTVDSDMARYVQIYVDAVQERVQEYRDAGAASVELLVEQRVPIGHLTGEEGAGGTSDAVILAVFKEHAVIDTWDLKYGRGEAVQAVNNPQAQMYALGALKKFDLLAEFTRARISISQPRQDETPREWELSIEDLQAFGEEAKRAAVEAQAARAVGEATVLQFPGEWLRPGEKACRFCKAAGTCPALREKALSDVLGDFDDLDAPLDEAVAVSASQVENADEQRTGELMAALPLVEQWVKAVRAHAESRLLSGQAVAGYKLVKGRAGPRAWLDAGAAEAALKKARIKNDDMYDRKVISPATAEKRLAKDKPALWKKLQDHIARSEGKPSVAPADDPRIPIVIEPIENDFEVIGDPAENTN